MANYHNRNKVLSYNALLNFICLDGGIGKSYSYSTLCVDNFLKDGSKFMYFRRYRTELKRSKEEFIYNIASNYPEHKLSIIGNKYFCDKKLMGYCACMADIPYLKSGVNKDINTFVFDEFIPENGVVRWVQKEPELIMSILFSTLRERSGHMYLLGNRYQKYTPYNIEFNLPPFDNNFYDHKRGILIYCNDPDAKSVDIYKNTPVEKLLRGTEYYKYRLENKPVIKNEFEFIRKRKGGHLICNLYTEGIYIGMYILDKCIYYDLNTDITHRTKYIIDKNNLIEGYKLFTKANYEVPYIKSAFRNGRVYYTSIKCKNLIEDFVKHIGS